MDIADSSPSPLVVVDTHIVLDWWIFKNPDCTDLLEEVSERRLKWIATNAMKEELMHVLARPHIGAKWHADPIQLLGQWRLHVNEVASPDLSPLNWPRCTDRDDQKFIDLALSQKARWLISRDRAVLKLAGRCRKLGLSVLDPGAWLAQWRRDFPAD